MVSRLSLLATVGVLTLASQARAADLQVVDSYLAITGLASPSRVAAHELRPLEAHIVTLGEGSAVVYYTYEEGAANVVRAVTTVGTDAEGAAAPARFVSYLSPGQRAEISVAGPVGTEAATLELVNNRGRLAVRPVTPPPEG